METSRDTTTRLLIRKFPKWLKAVDKESLLKCFGAVEVSVMADKGKMKNCVFAQFSNHEEAKMAMMKLHQLDLFGSKLVAVYATETEAKQGSVYDNMDCDALKKKQKKSPSPSSEQCEKVIPTHTPPPGLSYMYPPPNQLIISNIANAISCVPNLYIQVLHLMNKMNLPPPFGPPAPAPILPPAPLISDLSKLSSDESEIESDRDVDKKTSGRSKPAKLKKARIGGKRRFTENREEIHAVPPPKKPYRVDDLFPDYTMHTKLQINAPLELHTETYITPPIENIYQIPESAAPVQLQTPPQETGVTSNESNNPSEEADKFISLSELQSNKISEQDMLETSVFKNYSPGEQSMRLYIKNLNKTVTDKDLRYIFGRYIDWTNEAHINSFDIRVMHQGRMKGQAFIGMPDEDLALTALQDTNGYLLAGKPMVVQFARSTKAKETDKIMMDSLSKDSKS